ncbi:MAG TPA: iron-sulfur cluster assembly protein IscA, partial [Gammaproteobacteria bacterium]|nr:iron-sulfur cluster assembly protein IscA [Gammaproteobacteria bacterium]
MAVRLTERAAKHVQEVLAKRGDCVGLRVGVKTSGCSGYAYKVDFADAIGPDDKVYEAHGVKLVIDPKSLVFLDGMEVDFVRQGLNEVFEFNNPNVKDQCGCGES